MTRDASGSPRPAPASHRQRCSTLFQPSA
ncbi:hypothetical protein F1193_14265 [Blastochloris sulfoviridis]|uniref:Uncharacterized protein n=1 Tax=Blastochloris sulfoviridis TaxID=50712 RepID=A0A5M6HNB6_9HYPH|nr:hypothetical protein F1193_14265 [Blastochloris sulfoviridis]